jgi:anaerobic magnesium-protoporphyrin IX monomethyl ester cyclase
MMKIALVNPPWSFRGSIYFGCQEPHLPLEYGYAAALLSAAGHTAKIIDAQARSLSFQAIREELDAFQPDMTVVTTAPSYLFWRCAPPELRIPMETLAAIKGTSDLTVVVGPHASTTPRATLKKLEKLGASAVVLGECEEVLVELCGTSEARWAELDSIAFFDAGEVRINGRPRSTAMDRLPALVWDAETITSHAHHHHRFDTPPRGPGAEIEASRGCPYHCTFCAKDNFRDSFRRRPIEVVTAELDGLLREGVRYVYFIDEIFLPNRPLLEALAARDVVFGVQLRIDNWTRPMLDLLGEAGCVSIEAGVESVTPEGRSLLDKRCRMSTKEMVDLLIHVRRKVPFVQANLLDGEADDPAAIQAFRQALGEHGVWANDPVPLFPYPGYPEYTRRWGAPDDQAWERALSDYLSRFPHLCDLQDSRPLPLETLERTENLGVL